MYPCYRIGILYLISRVLTFFRIYSVSIYCQYFQRPEILYLGYCGPVELLLVLAIVHFYLIQYAAESYKHFSRRGTNVL